MLNNRFFASVAIIFAALAVYFFIIPNQVVVDGFGGSLGAALVPKLATGLIIALVLLDLAGPLLRTAGKIEKDEPAVVFGKVQLAAMLAISAIFSAFSFFLYPLGYPLAAFILVFVIMTALGTRPVIRAFALSLVIAGLLYSMMRFGFGTNLPIFPRVL